jgi:hypothetical protein
MSYKLQIQNSCYTIYPRNMVCFKYRIVNILHKGYNRDNNNNNNNNNNNKVQLEFCEMLSYVLFSTNNSCSFSTCICVPLPSRGDKKS